jgi:hypothetical protein
MKTIVIENVRGQWVVDKTTTGAFREENTCYSDGALIELAISNSRSLCCHPDSGIVCPHQKGS